MAMHLTRWQFTSHEEPGRNRPLDSLGSSPRRLPFFIEILKGKKTLTFRDAVETELTKPHISVILASHYEKSLDACVMRDGKRNMRKEMLHNEGPTDREEIVGCLDLLYVTWKMTRLFFSGFKQTNIE